jgi:hypothetical protein
MGAGGEREVLFIGDDWAEDHHDVEVQDETGSKLAARRLPAATARRISRTWRSCSAAAAVMGGRSTYGGSTVTSDATRLGPIPGMPS